MRNLVRPHRHQSKRDHSQRGKFSEALVLMLLEAFFAMLLGEPAPEPLPDLSPFDVLSDDELLRLTHWKWKYALEAEGWTTREACHLAFLRHLHRVGQL